METHFLRHLPSPALWLQPSFRPHIRHPGSKDGRVSPSALSNLAITSPNSFRRPLPLTPHSLLRPSPLAHFQWRIGPPPFEQGPHSRSSRAAATRRDPTCQAGRDGSSASVTVDKDVSSKDQTSADSAPSSTITSPSAPPLPSSAAAAEASVYQPSPLDDFFLMLFRRKLVKETGWKSPKAGYDGMIEEAKRLLNMSPDRQVAESAAVRILLSFFPPGLLPLFKRFLAPGLQGKLGPILSAVVTLVTCQWLMGPSKSSEVQLPDGSTLRSGVKIEKCRFLEETKCAGSCIHTCKMPTQAFMAEHMGVPLYMEPNLEDFSCEFKFGVPAPAREDDEILRKPCLSICPAASTRPQAAFCPEVNP